MSRFYGPSREISPAFEINIYLGSDAADPDSDSEIQDIQSFDSMDSGWGFLSLERVREVGEDI